MLQVDGSRGPDLLNMERWTTTILLMAEILHLLRNSFLNYLHDFSLFYIPNGAGFQPSTAFRHILAGAIDLTSSELLPDSPPCSLGGISRFFVFFI